MPTLATETDQQKWDSAITQARALLARVENRAARLQGAIGTFTDARDDDPTHDWEPAINQARELLERVENRAARLKGAIATLTYLRDRGHKFGNVFSHGRNRASL
jgi:hypothetical protein